MAKFHFPSTIGRGNFEVGRGYQGYLTVHIFDLFYFLVIALLHHRPQQTDHRGCV